MKLLALVGPVAAVAAVCPEPPPGVQAYADKITGNVMWGVLTLFLIGVLIGLGAIVAGRIFHMPHASKAGIVSVVMVVLAAVGYVVMPGMVKGITGRGCTAAPAQTYSVVATLGRPS